MLRAAISAGLSCAALAACAHTTVAVAPTNVHQDVYHSEDVQHADALPHDAGDRYYFDGRTYEREALPPLQVRLWGPPSRSRGFGPTGGFSLYVSRPAYVAMFEIVPGAGVRLLYPSYGQAAWPVQGYFTPFLANWRTPWRHGPSEAWYHGFPATRSSEHRFGWGYDLGARGQGPTYVLAIASESPMPLEMRWMGGIHASLNHRLASYNPWATVDALTRLLQHGTPAGSFASDVVVLWPDDERRRGFGSRGTVVVLPGAPADSTSADSLGAGPACPDATALGRAGTLTRVTARLCTGGAPTSGETLGTTATIRDWRQAERRAVTRPPDDVRERIEDRVRGRSDGPSREERAAVPEASKEDSPVSRPERERRAEPRAGREVRGGQTQDTRSPRREAPPTPQPERETRSSPPPERETRPAPAPKREMPPTPRPATEGRPASAAPVTRPAEPTRETRPSELSRAAQPSQSSQPSRETSQPSRETRAAPERRPAATPPSETRSTPAPARNNRPTPGRPSGDGATEG